MGERACQAKYACRLHVVARRRPVGAAAAAEKGAAARTLALSASTISWLGAASVTRQEADSYFAQPERDEGSRRDESLRQLSGCALRTAWRTRPQPASGDDIADVMYHDSIRANAAQCRCVRPAPTCVYADMNRLKSNEAILARSWPIALAYRFALAAIVR